MQTPVSSYLSDELEITEHQAAQRQPEVCADMVDVQVKLAVFPWHHSIKTSLRIDISSFFYIV